jgi:nitroimidazol reductase NimA-like FMN-containing flavoprotein (pyridoxamine 5'-phosphate oxidase superfamily)
MAHRLSGKVLAFVRSERVARLATIGPGSTPHNVPVCPVAISGRIYFATERDARKVRNLHRNPRAALVFDHYSENWKRLAGAMIVGTCTISDQGSTFRRARQALYRKYKLYPDVAPIEEGQSVIVCLVPTTSFSWGL